MDTTDPRLLEAAASRAARRPGYVAPDLARFADLVGEEPASWLDIAHSAVNRLALCRTPRRGSHFGHDVVAIASHLDIDPVRLASMIRLVDVLPELQQRAPQLDTAGATTATALAAARDETDEHTVLTDAPSAGPGLPGWLHDAVNQFWADAPAMGTYPRDLDFAILIGLPLAVVELPELSVAAVAQWLTAHKVELMLTGPDRRIRACLVALGGVGLVFVDAGDDDTQRRVSLAHEAGHFIVEYLMPRRDVVHRRPELLPVLDGERPPTAQERISAVLGDVAIGVHTHLLDRDGHGGQRVDAAEWRARRVALELLAPQAAVEQRMRDHGLLHADAVRKLLIDDFGLPVSLAADYASQLTADFRPRELGVLDLLGRNPANTASNDITGEGPDRTSGSNPEEDE